MKLIYHECYRNFHDRLLMVHDQQWLAEKIEEVCRQHFYVVDQLEDFVLQESSLQNSRSQESVGDDEDGIDPKRKDQFLWPIEDPE